MTWNCEPSAGFVKWLFVAWKLKSTPKLAGSWYQDNSFNIFPRKSLDNIDCSRLPQEIFEDDAWDGRTLDCNGCQWSTLAKREGTTRVHKNRKCPRSTKVIFNHFNDINLRKVAWIPRVLPLGSFPLWVKYTSWEVDILLLEPGEF